MKNTGTSLNISALFDEASSLELTNSERAVEAYENIFKQFFNSDKENSVKALFRAAVVCQSAGNFKQAVLFFNRAIENGHTEPADCFERLGDIYSFISDSTSAIDSYFKAAAQQKENEKIVLYAQILNKIGDCYKLIGEYQNAIEQHKKANEIFELQSDLYNECLSNFYIGNCYNWADELDVAYNYLAKSLALADKLRNPELKIKPQGSLAILLTKTKKYDLSQDYFFQAIDNANLTGNTTIKADLLKSLGNLYIEIGDYNKALSTLHEALEITEKIQAKFPANLIHQFLSKAFERKGDYEKALYHFKQYYNLCKEINADQSNIKSIGLQLKYDTDELKKEKLLAEQNLLLKDKFLASISHELRTPLNGIIGMTEVLSDSKLEMEQVKHLDIIKSSAFNLMSVINDLFNYALLNTGQIKKEETTFSIDELFNAITQSNLENKNIDEAAFKIESSVTNLVFVTDRYILERILKPILFFVKKNNMSNATTIKVKADRITTDEDVVLKFSIPFNTEKEIETLNYFVKDGNPAKTDSENGYEYLSISNALKFAEILDGRITLIGSYPSYEIHLSLLVRTAINTNVAGERMTSVQQEKSFFRILLVDDNKVNQFLAKTLLSKHGYRVDVASSAEEAFKKIQSSDYSVVITDIHMPGKNGYELTSDVRSLGNPVKSKTPIFALTAYESPTEKSKAKEVGITEFLSKPFNPSELLNLLGKYIGIDQKAIVETSNEPIINADDVRGNLERIMGGSKTETNKLVKMLKDQIPALLVEIETCVQKKEYENAFKSLHKLKSSVALLGVKRIDELVEILEKNYRSQKNINDSLKKFDEFKKLCSKTISILKS